MIGKRHNKLAQGMSENEERHQTKGIKRISNPKHPDYNPKYEDLLSLMVHGTCDKLVGGTLRFMKKKVKIEHPQFMGYFKEVYILNDWGKAKVKRMKKELLTSK